MYRYFVQFFFLLLKHSTETQKTVIVQKNEMKCPCKKKKTRMWIRMNNNLYKYICNYYAYDGNKSSHHKNCLFHIHTVYRPDNSKVTLRILFWNTKVEHNLNTVKLHKNLYSREKNIKINMSLIRIICLLK